MNKMIRFALAMLIFVAIAGLQACQEDLGNSDLTDAPVPGLKSSSMNTFYSSTIPVGNGVARAWIATAKNGEPMSVGIDFSGKALENLPDETQQFVFTMPKNKGMNFYTHALFDWNPHGHDPNGIYGLAHFDFHFYIVPNEERLAIPLILPPDKDSVIDEMYVPENYEMDMVTVPAMGTHWLDMDSPEWNGETFTKTFIWGSYMGEFVFWEPMITYDYLKTYPDDYIAIKQPEAFKRSGWYPTNYIITHSMAPDQFTVAITDLVYREGTED